MQNVDKTILEETEKLLSAVGVNGSVSLEEEEGSYSAHIATEENALLIGKHGNTLSSFEHILALIVAKKLGEFVRVIVEVGGYRKEREEYLKDLAIRLRDDVAETGVEKTIRGLKPWERRVVHLVLSEDSEVATESNGDGRDRILVIKKK